MSILLRSFFQQPDAATITSPLVCVPGPGKLAFSATTEFSLESHALKVAKITADRTITLKDDAGATLAVTWRVGACVRFGMFWYEIPGGVQLALSPTTDTYGKAFFYVRLNPYVGPDYPALFVEPWNVVGAAYSLVEPLLPGQRYQGWYSRTTNHGPQDSLPQSAEFCVKVREWNASTSTAVVELWMQNTQMAHCPINSPRWVCMDRVTTVATQSTFNVAFPILSNTKTGTVTSWMTGIEVDDNSDGTAFDPADGAGSLRLAASTTGMLIDAFESGHIEYDSARDQMVALIDFQTLRTGNYDAAHLMVADAASNFSNWQEVLFDGVGPIAWGPTSTQKFRNTASITMSPDGQYTLMTYLRYSNWHVTYGPYEVDGVTPSTTITTALCAKLCTGDPADSDNWGDEYVIDSRLNATWAIIESSITPIYDNGKWIIPYCLVSRANGYPYQTAAFAVSSVADPGATDWTLSQGGEVGEEAAEGEDASLSFCMSEPVIVPTSVSGQYLVMHRGGMDSVETSDNRYQDFLGLARVTVNSDDTVTGTAEYLQSDGSCQIYANGSANTGYLPDPRPYMPMRSGGDTPGCLRGRHFGKIWLLDHDAGQNAWPHKTESYTCPATNTGAAISGIHYADSFLVASGNVTTISWYISGDGETYYAATNSAGAAETQTVAAGSTVYYVPASVTKMPYWRAVRNGTGGVLTLYLNELLIQRRSIRLWWSDDDGHTWTLDSHSPLWQNRGQYDSVKNGNMVRVGNTGAAWIVVKYSGGAHVGYDPNFFATGSGRGGAGGMLIIGNGT